MSAETDNNSIANAYTRRMERNELASSKKKTAKQRTAEYRFTNTGVIKGKKKKKERFVLGNRQPALTCQTLLGLVNNTAPYFNLSLTSSPTLSSCSSTSFPPSSFQSLQHGSDGWLYALKNASSPVLARFPTDDERVAYFELCLAAHFSTCASYVPTDVDSKIRGHCFFDKSESVINKQFELLLNAYRLWDVASVSTRIVRINDDEILSGHDGEFLSCFVASWGAFLRIGNAVLAKEAESIILAELEREAAAFRKLRTEKNCNSKDTTTLLKLATILTHNAGGARRS